MSEQIVIVGFGPVAARLVDELLPAVRSGLATLTVVGEESEAAYNRVLVADLGVGRTTTEALALSDAAELAGDGGDIRLGVRVKRVDRARQQVILSDGGAVHYDRLVFATGSRPVIPNLTGINPDPKTDVHAVAAQGCGVGEGEGFRSCPAHAKVSHEHAVVGGFSFLAHHCKGYQAAADRRQEFVNQPGRHRAESHNDNLLAHEASVV